MPKYDLNISPEYVKINGLSQWFHYFGTNGSKPIILFLHGGPGTPETPFIEKYNKNLMEDFIIVCWEQRGAGKSYSFRIQDTSMNMEQFIDDAHKATQYLKNKFDREKIYLMGHSWGTLLGIRTINKHPDDYLGYFAIAQTSNSYEEEMVIHNWLIKQATAISHKKALRQLAKICTPQKDRDISFSDIATKTKWVNYFGGAAFYNDRKAFKKLVKVVIHTRVYNLIDKLNYLRAEKYSLSFLHREITKINLPEEIKQVKIPIIFFHGTGDYQVPISVAKKYYEIISAPYKNFIEFQSCAHGLLIEKPEEFKDKLLSEIKKIENTKRKFAL